MKRLYIPHDTAMYRKQTSNDVCRIRYGFLNVAELKTSPLLSSTHAKFITILTAVHVIFLSAVHLSGVSQSVVNLSAVNLSVVNLSAYDSVRCSPSHLKSVLSKFMLCGDMALNSDIDSFVHNYSL